MAADNDDLVTVASYATPPEAHVARLVLEQEGIEVFIADENLRLYWIGDIKRVEVRVRLRDARRAVDLLEGLRSR